MFFGVLAFTLPAFRDVAKRYMGRLNGKNRAGDSGKGGAEGMQCNRSRLSGWSGGSGGLEGNLSSVVRGTSTGDTDGDSFQLAEKVCDPSGSQTELTSRQKEG